MNTLPQGVMMMMRMEKLKLVIKGGLKYLA